MDRCHLYKPFDSKIACEVGDFGIQVEGAKKIEDAELIADAFQALPHSFRTRFGFASDFVILDPEEFLSIESQDDAAFSPKIGINVHGKTWYFNSRIFEPPNRKNFTDYIVFAVSSIVAQEMKGEDGFDPLSFIKVFRKVVRREHSASPEERPYYSYLSKLSHLNNIDANTLKQAFQKMRQDEDRLQRTRFSIDLPPQLNPWIIHSTYQRFVQEGYRWRATPNDVVILNLQSLNDMEKPGSSHRLNLYYYSSSVNEHLGSIANSLNPQLGSRVLWAPGIMGSYEQWDPSGGKEVRVILGSQLDVGINLKESGLFLHTYVGWPTRIWGGAVGALKPEWELGLRYTGLGGTLFIGTMFSSSLYDLQSKYFGALLRWRG